MRYHERMIMLSVLDQQWKDHLLNMDHLKEGIGLRGYGQKDPLVEYKRESFEMFEEMMQRFQEDTSRYLYLMQIVSERGGRRSRSRIHADAVGSVGDGARPPATSLDEIEKAIPAEEAQRSRTGAHGRRGCNEEVVQVRRGRRNKVGRNDPCPCGSGKKYKKCHGAAA